MTEAVEGSRAGDGFELRHRSQEESNIWIQLQAFSSFKECAHGVSAETL